jgi:4-amino-4-deoxy-L-arabinose transferase-like glycosyltransferase
MNFLKKQKKIILFVIILTGFILRFYPAVSVPITWDEEMGIKSVQNISFDYDNLQLPLIDETAPAEETSPMATKYIVKLWWLIFGDSLLVTRLLFIIFHLLTILIVYFLTKNTLGIRVALLSSLLLSISQFNVALGRTISHDSIHMFFVLLSIFLFYKAFEQSDKNSMILNGLIIGIGFWVKESMFFLVPIYLIFLLNQPNGRKQLKNKYLWFSFCLAFLISLPLLILKLDINSSRREYFFYVVSFGPSLNSIGFYLGELILGGVKWATSLGFLDSLAGKLTPISWIEGGGTFFQRVADTLTRETPPVNFMLGIIILIAAVKSIFYKMPLIRLLLICFLFNFLLFSFIRKADVIDGVWSFGSLEWGVMGFFPGVILASNVLINYFKKNKKKGIILIGLLILFVFARTFNMAVCPLCCYFPTKEKCMSDYIGDSERFLKTGKTKLAKNTLKKVYQCTDEMPGRKKGAALWLAEILIKEGNHKKAAEYIDYLILNHPGDDDVRRLMKQIK